MASFHRKRTLPRTQVGADRRVEEQTAFLGDKYVTTTTTIANNFSSKLGVQFEF